MSIKDNREYNYQFIENLKGNERIGMDKAGRLYKISEETIFDSAKSRFFGKKTEKPDIEVENAAMNYAAITTKILIKTARS